MSSKSDSVDSYWTVQRNIKQAMSLAVEELECSLNEPIGIESDACKTDYSMHMKKPLRMSSVLQQSALVGVI